MPLAPMNLCLASDGGAKKPSTDSVLLASFATLKRNARVCDLGAGTGILALLLAGREAGARIDAVELRDGAHACLLENIGRYALEERVRAHRADYRALRGVLTAGAYDLVVSNPPYFRAGSGRPKAGGLSAAHQEEAGTIGDLLQAANLLLRTGGRVAVSFRPERIADLFAAMRGADIEPKRLRFVHHTAAHAPSIVLFEGVKGGKPGLRAGPPLLLRDETGETEEVRRIYGRDI